MVASEYLVGFNQSTFDILLLHFKFKCICKYQVTDDNFESIYKTK